MSELEHYEAIATDFAALVGIYQGNVKAIHGNKQAIAAAKWILDNLPKVGCPYVTNWDSILKKADVFGQVFLSRELHPEKRPTIFEFLFERPTLPPGKPSMIPSTGVPRLDLLSGLVVNGGFDAAHRFYCSMSMQDIQRVIARYNQAQLPDEELEKQLVLQDPEMQRIMAVLDMDSVRMRHEAQQQAKQEGRTIYEI